MAVILSILTVLVIIIVIVKSNHPGTITVFDGEDYYTVEYCIVAESLIQDGLLKARGLVYVID